MTGAADAPFFLCSLPCCLLRVRNGADGREVYLADAVYDEDQGVPEVRESCACCRPLQISCSHGPSIPVCFRHMLTMCLIKRASC